MSTPIHSSQLKSGAARPWLSRFARWFLRTIGWQLEGNAPDLPKFILMAVPHTSYLDTFLMILVAWAFGARISWLGADKFFIGPMSWVLKRLGGISISRRGNNDIVQQAVEAIKQTDQMVLAIAPEGTTYKTEFWRSGFYRIAQGANIPLVFGFLDFGRKRTGILGEPFWVTGNMAADMTHIRQVYEGVTGRFPELQAPVRLRDEG